MRPFPLARAVLAIGLAALTGVVLAPAATAAPGGPQRAVVSVSVATVWTSSAAPRERDRAAVSAPADPGGWVSSMTVADRRELTTASRTQTQVLYGAPVTVLERRDGWARVVVPGQPSAKDPRGYPGWIPEAQLASGFDADAVAQPAGTVAGVATIRLYRDEARTDHLLEVSVGTRLPVQGGDARSTRLALPGGGSAWAAARHVQLGEADPPSGADLVRTARLFLDRPYLWGGRSGFGPDCSGLTGLVLALHGVTVGRDASDQASGGRPVARDALEPGDLLFWGSPATHVAMYAGGGRMIEALDAATPVHVTPLRPDFGAARRYPV